MTQLTLSDRFRRAVRNFHEGDEGMETLQVVIIIAVAAVVIIGAMLIYTNIIAPYANTTTKNVTKFQQNAPAAPTFSS